MAGIVAFFGNDHSVVSDLLNGLASRGRDTVTWREGQVGLATRAALPAIHTGDGLAAAVDGVTETSRLLAGYRTHGPRALVRARDPYTIAVADPGRSALLLARSGDGPTLYYASMGGTLLAAAEPAALLAAGVPAEADAATIRHFVATGECDHTDATFFSGIRRLLPGQVVEVTRTGRTGLRVSVTDTARDDVPALALPLVVADAVRQGRVGVRLGGDPEADPVLAAVRVQPSAHRPIPAYQPVFSGSEPPPTTRSGVRIHAVPVTAERFLADLPAFLTDLGEPVGDLSDYLLWRTAQTGMGDVDVLLAPGARGADGQLSRVADRVAARFGVDVRLAPGHSDDTTRLVADLLRSIKDRVYGCFLTEEFASRPWVDANTATARFDGFVGGSSRYDPRWFWRLFLVEQWLRLVVGGDGEAQPPARDRFSAHPGKELVVAVDGKRWVRLPVRTRLFGPGERVAKQVAGYVAELVAEARANPRYRDLFGKPWYVVVAEKVVAMSQRRSYPLWEIRPGWPARTLVRLVTRTPWGPGTPSAWTMQLAIREAGLARMLLAALAGLLGRPFGRRHWFDRVAGPRAAAIDGPGKHSGSPVSLSATLGAADPERVAEQLESALRLALPVRAAEHLRGCVVMDLRDSGCRVRGSSADRPAEFFAEAFADNPLGQGAERTPIGVMVTASAVRRPKRAKPASARRRPTPTR